ncbi:hypothetical protein HPB52_011158 [Rhipicephalus sanguineus]|uniref:Uncharacterized protein n=1 Tax=Rhipicephalus sanguineus TaxID=34632 RepID=A0A9D4PQZ4_RHISA|nr:hypothetical protein HPB52_011158 [Rhipicephalus sanguineus]
MRSGSTGCEKSAIGSGLLSLQTQSEDETKNKLSSFADLLKALPGFEHSDFWTVIHKDSKVYFLDLALHSAPTIRASVIVSTGLRIEVFFGEAVVRNCGDVLVPEKIYYDDLEVCDSGHSAQEVMEHVESAAANTLLNNLCRTENDKSPNAKNERKLKTLKT